MGAQGGQDSVTMVSTTFASGKKHTEERTHEVRFGQEALVRRGWVHTVAGRSRLPRMSQRKCQSLTNEGWGREGIA